MSNSDLITSSTATDLRLALSDPYPDSTYDAVPVIDQFDALAAYRVFDEGALRPMKPRAERNASNGRLRISGHVASADAVHGLSQNQWIRCDRGKEHANGSVASNRIRGSELT